jgi:hypothetical protein
MKRYLSRIASRVNSTPGFTPVRPSIPHWYAVHSPGFSNPFEEEAAPGLGNDAVSTPITAEDKPLINVEKPGKSNSSKDNIPETIASPVTKDIESPGKIDSIVEPGKSIQDEPVFPFREEPHESSPIKDLPNSKNLQEERVKREHTGPGSEKTTLPGPPVPSTPFLNEPQFPKDNAIKKDVVTQTRITHQQNNRMTLPDIMENKQKTNEPGEPTGPTLSIPVQQLNPGELNAPGLANDKSKVSRVFPKESKENQKINHKNDRHVQELRPNAPINPPDAPPVKRSGTGPKLVINRLQVEVVTPPKVIEEPPPPVKQTPPVKTPPVNDSSGAGFKLRFGLGQI